MVAAIEVIDGGVLVKCNAAQIAAWTRAARDQPLPDWLAEVADDEAAAGEAERTWPFVVKLKHPVQMGSELVASLEFRRGRIGDLKGMKLGDTVPTEQLVLVASRLCGQPVKVIEMLDIDDGGEVMDIALDFFAKSLTAGRKR